MHRHTLTLNTQTHIKLNAKLNDKKEVPNQIETTTKIGCRLNLSKRRRIKDSGTKRRSQMEASFHFNMKSSLR